MANLVVVCMVKNDFDECSFFSKKMFTFLTEIPINKRTTYVQECIYILFRHQTLIELNDEYINNMKSNIQDFQLGCFNMVIGLTKELKNDLDGALEAYIDAFSVFKNFKDELFILLVTTHIL